MNHEAWLVAARGIFDQYLADLNALNDKDTRAVFVYYGYHRGRLAFRAWQELGYAIAGSAVDELNACIDDIVYKPRYRAQLPPIPQNAAAAGGVISCDPVEGVEVEVYRFADGLFEYVGPLDASVHSAGAYVLAARSGSLQGLPSALVVVD